MTRGVYLLHFCPAYKHAAHYLGWADDIPARLREHLAGRGARLVQVAVEAGCTVHLVRVWQNQDRKCERRLKKRKKSPCLCPVCKGKRTLEQIQLSLDPGLYPQNEVTGVEELSELAC
jgi:predicted GIY-YIG superfamily endonuclease